MNSTTDMYSHMLAQEMRGTCDVDGAMRRIEALYGIPYGAQWNFRYRHDRKPSKTFCERVQHVYLSFLKRSVSTTLEQLKAEMARGEDDGDAAILKAEAEALLVKIEARIQKVDA